MRGGRIKGKEKKGLYYSATRLGRGRKKRKASHRQIRPVYRLWRTRTLAKKNVGEGGILHGDEKRTSFRDRGGVDVVALSKEADIWPAR